MAASSSNGWSQLMGPKSGSSGGLHIGVSQDRVCRHRRRQVRVRAQAGSGSLADEHEVLGVSPSASRHEIKAAYRRLALQYHPDVCKEDDCDQRFRQINDAYEALVKSVQKEQEPVTVPPQASSYDDSWLEWDEWMGYEGGVPHQWLGSLSFM